MIPVNEPLLDGNEKKYLAECIDSGWISSEGPFVTRLEETAARYTGRAYGVAVSSGSAALDIAVAALDLRAGDEVILPTFTIISCLSAVVRTGALPVFVDADPASWCMDVSQVEARLTERTRAIMAVHIYGLAVDMAPLVTLCEQRGLALIEDTAEGLGCVYDNQRCGSFGTCSILSFYPNKLVTTGEGGMILTDDPDFADRCRSLRNLCFQSQQRFVHKEFGWNYRLSNLQAAVGVAQFERADVHLARKKHIGNQYQAALSELDKVELPLPQTTTTINVYWVFGIVLKDIVPFAAAEAAARLAELGIGTRPFFWPMHLQPVLSKINAACSGDYPVAERLGTRGLYLPSGTAMTDEQVRIVSDALIDIVS